MFAWLSLALVIASVSVAIAATVAAWRVRRTTPRTTSLALSLAACTSVLVSTADLSIPLPASLCVRTLEPHDGELQEALEQELGGWHWWWRPCGRLEIEVTLEDLTKPVDFAGLAALAGEAGVAVDVTPGETTPWPGEQLVLTRTDETGQHFGIQAPVPASQTDKVQPALARGSETPLSCRIDGDPADSARGAGATPNLQDLLEGTDRGDFRGFHHLDCQPRTASSDRRTSAYVRVSESGVMVASNNPDVTVHFDGDSSSFGLYLAPERAVPETAPELEHASMLVLDRPERSESCSLARRLLARGGSVVVTMPTEQFLADCDLLPVRAMPTRDNRAIYFDRRPRLTFVLDDFAKNFKWSPSVIFGGPGPYHARAIEPLKDSVEIQEAKALESCKELLPNSQDCANPATSLEPDLYRSVSSPILDRSGLTSLCRPFSEDCERLERSSPARAAEEVAAQRSQSQIYWENELLVLFTHDQRDPDLSSSRILERGSRVHVALVQDPFGRSLSKLITAHGSIAQNGPNVDSLVVDPTKRLSGVPFAPPSHGADPYQRSLELALPRLDSVQSAAAPVPHAIGRFDLYVPGSRDKAPVRFGWYQLREQAAAGQVPPVRLAHTTRDSGLTERLLAAGAVVDRGHLLFLGYSPFEHQHGYTSGWDDAPMARDVLGGYRAIEKLYEKTEAFLTRIAGNILSVDLQPDGAVWVTLVMSGDPEGEIREVLSFVGPKTTIEAPLIEMDPNGGWLTYALPARDLGTKLSGCEPLIGDGLGEDERIYACPPQTNGPSMAALNAATSLQLLAYYTGGRSGPNAQAPGEFVHTRSIGLCALSLILLVAWGRRAIGRLSARAARRQLSALERASQRRYDPPDAVVAAAGDWDGRSSTWPRTGPFGGFRALEAGDRPSAIVLQDLVLAAQGGPQLLPRVVTRIEESAPSVCVLVHLGESMRAARSSRSGKALCASRVASHVASAAWKIRAEVAVLAAGVRGETEIVAPTHLSPGHEIVETNLQERLRQSAVHPRTPWPEELPECGAVVYMSDFLTEDERALHAWASGLEGAGIRVAGVMIYSPAEFTMIEGGRLAGSGTWVDRADWTPDDVFAAFSRRRDEIERIFDVATTGGMIVVATHFGQDDIELSLAGGRLLQILR